MERSRRHFKETVEAGVFKEGQQVDVVICEFSKLGAKAVINDTYAGLIYADDIFHDIKIGQRMKAYIKLVRQDGKIDLTLRQREGLEVAAAAERIMRLLCDAGGKLDFNDKSSPDDIYMYFQTSKKVFKKAIGALYKKRKIRISDKGIEKI